MMAALFLGWLIAGILAYRGSSRAWVMGLVTLGLCLLMFLHHATDTLKVNL